MIVTTTNEIKDYEIIEYLGLVNANEVIGANFISDWFASWTDMLGGYSNTYKNRLDEIYSKALKELQNKASKKDANALLGVHFYFNEISSKGKAMFMVTATGTAVKIAPQSPQQPQSSKYDIYQKMYNLTLFKESGVITQEQYDAEKRNLILLHKNELNSDI